MDDNTLMKVYTRNEKNTYELKFSAKILHPSELVVTLDQLSVKESIFRYQFLKIRVLEITDWMVYDHAPNYSTMNVFYDHLDSTTDNNLCSLLSTAGAITDTSMDSDATDVYDETKVAEDETKDSIEALIDQRMDERDLNFYLASQAYRPLTVDKKFSERKIKQELVKRQLNHVIMQKTGGAYQ